jgi:hypothetical protein
MNRRGKKIETERAANRNRRPCGENAYHVLIKLASLMAPFSILV